MQELPKHYSGLLKIDQQASNAPFEDATQAQIKQQIK